MNNIDINACLCACFCSFLASNLEGTVSETNHNDHLYYLLSFFVLALYVSNVGIDATNIKPQVLHLLPCHQ